jgi:carbonic anhydrase
MKRNLVSYMTRRNLFKMGSTAVGTGFVTNQLGIGTARSAAAATNRNLTPDSAFNELVAGNKRFASQKTLGANRGTFRLREVAQGQKPFAAILGCADSRVPSEIIFDQGLGDLFVVRVAGNVATSEEIGSLEYGTLVLGAKVLLVLGHEKCGAVKAAIDNQPVPGRIGAILEHIQPAVASTAQSSDRLAVASTSTQSSDRLKDTTIANIKNQIAILKSSSVISELVASKKLKIVGGFYDLDTGLMTTVV